jgi:hypothetical protein
MTIYDIPSIVIQSLPDALTPTSIKSGFLVKAIWPLNIDVFTDEDASPSAGTDRLEHSGLADSCASDSNFIASSQPSTSGLNTGHSSSEAF